MSEAIVMLHFSVLAQQGQFPKFLFFCCGGTLVFAIVLGCIFFGIRWFANREDRG